MANSLGKLDLSISVYISNFLYERFGQGTGLRTFSKKAILGRNGAGETLLYRNGATLQATPVSCPLKSSQNPFRLNYADFVSLELGN
jgi:hypothetical protein